MQHLPRPEDLPPGIDPPRPISVTFIPATVFDNPALLRVNPEYLRLAAVIADCSSASGCWAAIGRSGRPPGSTSSANGVPSSTRSRPISMSCAIGISPRPKRPSSTTPIGRSASSSAATGTAATGCLDMVRARANPGDVERLLRQHRRAGRQAGRASGSARIRDRPARARRCIWCARSSGFTVTPAPESGDKLTRFGPFSSQCRAGNVKIRRGSWNEELFRVLEGFPDLAHDDEVDACSGALEMLNPNMKHWGYIEWMRDEAEKKKEQEKPPPPKTNYAVGSVEWAREHGVALEDLDDSDARVCRSAQSARGPADSIDQRDRANDGSAENRAPSIGNFSRLRVYRVPREVHCAAVFIKSIRCRARKTILSPALISPDTVHRRKATLSGSMRRVLQNVSSPNWCCSA